MSWSKFKPTDFAIEVVQKATKEQKTLITQILQQVIIRSPVMDGEFRASHKVSIGRPINNYEKGYDLSGAQTLSDGVGVVAKVNLGDIAYVQTNSPYGVALEHGHSQQAPQGIYGLTVEYIKSKYK